MTTVKKEPMAKLVHILNSKIVETIEYNKSFAVCNWTKNKIKSNYKIGLLQVRGMDQ